MADESRFLYGQELAEATPEELALNEYAIQSEGEQIRMDARLEELEIERANQLALAQAEEQEEEEETARAPSLGSMAFSGPSLFKYALLLLIFALPNDVIDLLEFTGFGIILSWLISLLLSAGMMLAMWFADSELEAVKSHMANIEKYKATAARTLTKVSAKLTKFAPRNPIAKVIAGTILEMIPILSIMPWSCICTGLAYWDERQTFKDAKRESAEGMSFQEAGEVV